MGNPQERQERKELRRDYRMEAKNMKADHRDSIRDVNRVIKGERLEDRLAKKQQKLQYRKEMEDLKSGYAATFHRKVDRLANKVKHGQHELENIRKSNQEFKADKVNMQGYESKAHKKSLKMKHRQYMQEQKGKHRNLKKKIDVNVNAPRTTDVDVNSDVDVWRPPMQREKRTTKPIPRKDNNSGGWLERIFMY